MSIELRARIAAAIDNEYTRVGLNPALSDWSDQLAEAVLKELRLHEEHGRLRVTRYVTDWYISR